MNLIDMNMIAEVDVADTEIDTTAKTPGLIVEHHVAQDLRDLKNAVPDITLGDVYERIAERLAEARTRALMGERQEALGLFHAASLDYTRFREVLRDYPGHHALEYAFTVTMSQMCAEQDRSDTADVVTEQPKAKSRTRRRAERAA